MNPKEKLVKFFKEKYDAKVQSNGVWYKLECPFCGDSDNPNTTHFNIRVASEDSLLVKKCFQPHCTASGILTQNDLIEMGLSNNKVLNFVSNKADENINYVNKISSTKLNLTLPEWREKPGEYFKRRTNEPVDKDSIKKYRIISNFKEFFEKNKTKLNYNKKLYSLMKREEKGFNYIGFLNDSGTFLYVRSIDDDYFKHKKIHLKKFPMYVSHKPYAIKRDFNIKEKMKIYLAEGVFDIINAYNYFNDRGLYVQTGSASSFFSKFERLSKYYWNVEWNFIKDKDVSIKLFKSIKRKYDYRFKYDPYVIKNTKANDIGDFSKPISIERIVI